MNCQKCFHRNMPGAGFCLNCGAELVPRRIRRPSPPNPEQDVRVRRSKRLGRWTAITGMALVIVILGAVYAAVRALPESTAPPEDTNATAVWNSTAPDMPDGPQMADDEPVVFPAPQEADSLSAMLRCAWNAGISAEPDGFELMSFTRLLMVSADELYLPFGYSEEAGKQFLEEGDVEQLLLEAFGAELSTYSGDLPDGLQFENGEYFFDSVEDSLADIMVFEKRELEDGGVSVCFYVTQMELDVPRFIEKAEAVLEPNPNGAYFDYRLVSIKKHVKRPEFLKISASSRDAADERAEMSADGNASTVWRGVNGGLDWLLFETEQSQTVSGVTLTGCADTIKRLSFEFSDGTSAEYEFTEYEHSRIDSVYVFFNRSISVNSVKLTIQALWDGETQPEIAEAWFF